MILELEARCFCGMVGGQVCEEIVGSWWKTIMRHKLGPNDTVERILDLNNESGIFDVLEDTGNM